MLKRKFSEDAGVVEIPQQKIQKTNQQPNHSTQAAENIVRLLCKEMTEDKSKEELNKFISSLDFQLEYVFVFVLLLNLVLILNNCLFEFS